MVSSRGFARSGAGCSCLRAICPRQDSFIVEGRRIKGMQDKVTTTVASPPAGKDAFPDGGNGNGKRAEVPLNPTPQPLTIDEMAERAKVAHREGRTRKFPG